MVVTLGVSWSAFILLFILPQIFGKTYWWLMHSRHLNLLGKYLYFISLGLFFSNEVPRSTKTIVFAWTSVSCNSTFIFARNGELPFFLVQPINLLHFREEICNNLILVLLATVKHGSVHVIFDYFV